MDEFTKKIIEAHNYIVRVKLVEPNIIEVDYVDKLQTRYDFYNYENICGVIFNKVEYLSLSPHVIRLYILCDIYRTCGQLKLPPTIVQYYGKEYPIIGILELIDIKLSEEEIVKEKKLNDWMMAIYDELDKTKKIRASINKFDREAEAVGLLHSLNLLKGLLI